MKTPQPIRPFQPRSADAAGVISWVHLGDLHMTRAGEQNHLDLAEIVNEVNRAFAGSGSFVFPPTTDARSTPPPDPLDRLKKGRSATP